MASSGQVTQAEAEADDAGCDYEEEMEISELVTKGTQYLQEKGDAFERCAFELDEDCGKCKIAGTLDCCYRVEAGLGRRMPRLMLF